LDPPCKNMSVVLNHKVALTTMAFSEYSQKGKVGEQACQPYHIIFSF